MSTKPGSLRLLKLSPGGRLLRSTILKLARGPGDLQVTAIGTPTLRGLRELLPTDILEAKHIELVPFGELISRVSRLSGLSPMRSAQQGLDEAAIAEACKLLPADRPLSPGRNMPGIHRALSATLRTLRAYGLDSARLDLLAEGAGEYLGAKLRDLGFVLRESEQSLHSLGREHTHAWLTRAIETDPAECQFEGKVAIVLSGELDPAIADWISWLGRTNAKITLLGESHGGIPSMFAEDVEFFPGAKVELSHDAEGIAERLFVKHEAPTKAVDVEVSAAADALAECEWAIRRAATETARGVAPPSVAIVARELIAYAPLLHAASQRLEVPISLSWRAPLLSNRLVSFFLDFLEALGSSDIRSLIRPLKSSYSGLNHETQTFVKEMLQGLHRSGGHAWSVLDEVADKLVEQIPWLEPVLEWRGEAVAEPAGPSEWFESIMALADLVPWRDSAFLDPEFAERDARATEAMQRALTERASLARLHRGPPMPYAAALHWIRTAWEQADYSIPSAAGGVAVVSSGAELGDREVVIVLGMVEGVMPRRPREDPILADLERERLSELAQLTTPLPTSRAEARREREEFVRICGSASRTLVLSYRLASTERDNIPTAYIEEATRAVVNSAKIERRRTQLVPELPALAADVRLARALEEPPQRLLPPDFRSAAVRSAFRWAADRPFRPRQLSRAAMCPFAFLARDVLNLQPARRAQLWNALLRLPVKASLATQPDSEAAEKALRGALEELIDEHVGALESWELALIRSGGRRIIEDWVRREFRARELWPRTGVETDVPIGSPGVRNRATSDVVLEGHVPALSTMGAYSMARLYEAYVPDRIDDESPDDEFLYYILWSVVALRSETASAIEVETLGPARRLFVFPRRSGELKADTAAGLYVSSMSAAEETAGRSVKTRARQLVARAASRAREAEVTPTPGVHCARCAYGELCRSSSEFGEIDELPVELDE